MMKNYLCKTAFTFLLCLGSVWSYAKPVLSALFSDNMVLQQNTQAPIWGEATPGKQVKITPSWSKETISNPMKPANRKPVSRLLLPEDPIPSRFPMGKKSSFPM